jgi:hypothetical protein
LLFLWRETGIDVEASFRSEYLFINSNSIKVSINHDCLTILLKIGVDSPIYAMEVMMRNVLSPHRLLLVICPEWALFPQPIMYLLSISIAHCYFSIVYDRHIQKPNINVVLCSSLIYLNINTPPCKNTNPTLLNNPKCFLQSLLPFNYVFAQ